METSDYLMRQFNQLGKVLGKLLADLFEPDNNANANQTLEIINQDLITKLDIDLETIIHIPTNELIEKFIEDFEADFTNFEDLAEFLYQVGYLIQAQDDIEKSNAIFVRALTVYQYLMDNGNTFSLEIHQKVNELIEILS